MRSQYALVVSLGFALTACSSGVHGSPPDGSPGGGGAHDFPSSSIIYQDISNAPLDSQSSSIIATLQSMGWNSGRKLGIDASFSILVADSSVTPRPFNQPADAQPDCDTAPIPVPPGGHIEGNADYACADGGDCHLLVYQGSRLYELYQADISGGMASGGTFNGSCLALWDLTRDYWANTNPYSRGEYCNGADAADLPMAALILKPDEVTAGKVNHALRFTIPNDHILAAVYVHPATHIGGPSGSGNLPPYGSRLRLSRSYDVSKLPSAAAQTVARALQTYGMFLADGGHIYISATDDIANAITPSDLSALEPQDFEVVDGGQRITWAGGTCTHVPITQ
jgi:serine/threonine-protein kinase